MSSVTLNHGHGRETVVLFLPNLEVGGAEVFMVDLANRLAASGVSVTLACCSARGPLNARISHDVNLENLDVRRTLFALPSLCRLIGELGPCAVVSTMVHANAIATLATRLAGTHAKLILREATLVTAKSSIYPKISTRVMLGVRRWAYPKADFVVAPTIGVENSLNALIPGTRVARIPNPVDIAQCREMGRPDIPEFMASQGPRVLACGRLDRYKGFELLIQAFAQSEWCQGSLWILGEGPERRNLERLGEACGLGGRLHMPGVVSNPHPYFSRADLFVMSSRHEGSPNVLLQALAHGCNVVSTDCETGPREFLGEHTQYLAPISVDGLAQTMNYARRVPLSSTEAKGCVEHRTTEHALEQFRSLWRDGN